MAGCGFGAVLVGYGGFDFGFGFGFVIACDYYWRAGVENFGGSGSGCDFAFAVVVAVAELEQYADEFVALDDFGAVEFGGSGS